MAQAQASAPPGASAIMTLILNAVAELQQAAARREATFRELGVFLLFSTAAGDAWFLEVTETDAVQVARNGEPVTLPLEPGAEDSETIVINWSHTFQLIDRQLQVTPYAQGESPLILPEAPTLPIAAAIRRIRKRYDEAVLNQVHQAAPEEPEQS